MPAAKYATQVPMIPRIKPPIKLPGMLPSPPSVTTTMAMTVYPRPIDCIYRVANADKRAGDARHGGAEAETQRQRVINIDPHQPGGGGVLGGRPDSLAGAGAL